MEILPNELKKKITEHLPVSSINQFGHVNKNINNITKSITESYVIFDNNWGGTYPIKVYGNVENIIPSIMSVPKSIKMTVFIFKRNKDSYIYKNDNFLSFVIENINDNVKKIESIRIADIKESNWWIPVSKKETEDYIMKMYHFDLLKYAKNGKMTIDEYINFILDQETDSYDEEIYHMYSNIYEYDYSSLVGKLIRSDDIKFYIYNRPKFENGNKKLKLNYDEIKYNKNTGYIDFLETGDILDNDEIDNNIFKLVKAMKEYDLVASFFNY